MSTDQHLHDLQVQHALNVLGYSNSLQRDVLAFLSDLEKDSLEILAARMATTDMKGYDPGPKATARKEEMIAEIRALTKGVYDQTHDHLQKELIGLSGSEAEFANKALNKVAKANVASKLPSPARLKSIVTEKPLHGKILKPWLDGMGAATADRVEQQMRLGLAAGEGIDKIVSRVTGVNGFEGSKTSARAMVRTAVSAVSNAAQQEAWKANSDFVTGWRFVATLDSSTTLICAANDAKEYPLGEGPIPPLHPQCRSITIAATKPLSGYKPNTRASQDGQVPASEDFAGFLKRKGEAFQDEVMGPTRADLWRRGKLNLNDFIRNYDQVIPLDELRRLHPEAFGGAVEEAVEIVAPAAPVRFSPINPNLTSTTIPRRSLREARVELGQQFKAAAEDSRYIADYAITRGVKVSDFGKAALPADLTDEAASMLLALKPEMDAISDAFAIPRLRGIRTVPAAKSHVMNHAEGTLGINATYTNGYAGSTATKASVDLDRITARLATLETVIKDGRSKYENTDGIGFFEEFAEEYNEYRDLKEKEWKLRQKVSRTEKVATRTLVDWKPGDDPDKRPWTVDQYFADPLDRMRSLLFHEMAHAVHDYFNNKGGWLGRTAEGRLVQKRPPTINELDRLFLKYGRETKEYDRRASKSQFPSQYATTKAVERWAENFALYCMGRIDLVEKEMQELIERMLDYAKNIN